MNRQQPFVAAIVLNWNGWRDTLACLESMMRLDYPRDRLGIVVCDNGSDDGSVQRVRDWASGEFVPAVEAPAALRTYLDPPVHKPLACAVVDEESVQSGTAAPLAPGITVVPLAQNRGFAGGNNVILRYLFPQAHVDCLWLVNNDIVVEPSALRALVETLDVVGQKAALGGMLFEYHEPTRLQEAGGGAFRMWQGLSVPRTSPPPLHGGLHYLSGGFLLAPREMLSRAGPMAEDYFMYGEDVDYSRRLRDGGAELRVVPEAKAWHKGGGSSRHRSPRHDYDIVRNGLQVVRRFSPLSLPAAMVYIAVRCGFPKVWRREWSRLAVLRRAYGDFAKGHMGRVGTLPGE
jgi:GT2 family glycosyltransferase